MGVTSPKEDGGGSCVYTYISQKAQGRGNGIGFGYRFGKSEAKAI